MDSVQYKARAKINLTLDVIAKRPDGYHDLEMVMQTIALYDLIQIKKIPQKEIILKSNVGWLPLDNRNLAYQAAKLLLDEFKIEHGVFIKLTKRIPIAAGLAGGSSDCAGVLKGINELFMLNLSQAQLMEYGLRLGSDVPYCILGGTALATGRGEKLKSLQACPKVPLVLIKPPISVSTAFVYKNLKLDKLEIRPNTQAMLQAIDRKDITAIVHNLCNVLETVTIDCYPKIEKIKQSLLHFGAKGVLMSGSGPTVFGIFEDKQTACIAADAVRQKTNWKDIIVTQTYQNEDKKGDRNYDRL